MLCRNSKGLGVYVGVALTHTTYLNIVADQCIFLKDRESYSEKKHSTGQTWTHKDESDISIYRFYG